MKHTLLLLTAIIGASVTAQAGRRTEQEMRAVACEHLQTKAYARGMGNQQISIEKVDSAETFCIYAPSAGNGFVVVSSDDASQPVLGYSISSYRSDHLPDGFRWWLNAINEALLAKPADAMFAKTRSAGYEPVENFVLSHWGQSKPYNALTPKQGARQSVTGCVATAMAQILNYYKYPESSTGTAAYTIDGVNTTNVDFSTVYDWDNILNEYNPNISYSDEDSRPIAELMRDCGYSAHMNYSAGSSGALMSEAALGLARNFRFNEAHIYYLMRDFYSDAEWMNLIYRELMARRPILYGGIDIGQSAGHAFVFSGIDDEGRIYVNWGWDGTADGFFDIADLGPKGILGRSLSHFNDGQDMVIGITPDYEGIDLKPKYSEMAFSYYELSPSLVKNRLNCITSTFYNLYYRTFKGTLDLLMIGEDGTQYTFNVLTEEKGVVYRYSFSSVSKMLNLTSLPAGTYIAYLASKAIKDTEYQPARCEEEGAIYYLVNKDENGTISIANEIYDLYSALTSIESIEAASVRSRNAFIYDLHGRSLGTDASSLGKGIYIIGRKKVVK